MQDYKDRRKSNRSHRREIVFSLVVCILIWLGVGYLIMNGIRHF